MQAPPVYTVAIYSWHEFEISIIAMPGSTGGGARLLARIPPVFYDDVMDREV